MNAEEANLLATGAAAELADKYLTFWTDRQLYAVPIAEVMQIVQVQEITTIPEFPYYAKGIINLRGTVIPVISIRLRLGREEVPFDDHTCIIVANIGERLIGFLVDSVDEVTSIGANMISPPPHMVGSVSDTFLTGIGRRGESVVLLLDAGKILSDGELSQLSGGM